MAIKGEERQGPRVPPSPFLCGGAKPTIRQLRAHGVGFSSKSAWFPMIKRSSLFPALSCDLIKKAERSDGPGPGCQRGRASHAGASLCVAPPGFYFCVCVCSELGRETTTTRQAKSKTGFDMKMVSIQNTGVTCGAYVNTKAGLGEGQELKLFMLQQ